MKSVLAAILIVFAAQVLAETNTDVIESFAPIFNQLHQEIDDIQAVAHGTTQQISHRFAEYIYRLEVLLIQDQFEAQRAFLVERQYMLERLNLSPTSDDVKACVASSDNDINLMILRSQGGLQVCKTADEDEVTQAMILVNEVYNKQAKEHRDLDGIKLYCNSISEDTTQLRNCLIHQLYAVHADFVNDLKGESVQIVENYETVTQNVGIRMLDCSNVVKQNILQEVDQIMLKFHNCCYDILEINRK